MATLFTVGVWATELTIRTFEAVTPWTAFAATLGGFSLFSMIRWQAVAGDEPQEEWQPGLMLRILGGGLAFQAGTIGYFVANDVVAASVGCGGFLLVIAVAMRAVGPLTFESA